jgi:hypothetical protein
VGQPEPSSSRQNPATDPRVLCFATQGAEHGEHARIRELLESLNPIVWPFDRRRRIRSWWRLVREVSRRPPDIVVMEGTGTAGGLALLMLRLAQGTPYVVSVGDAVGPYIATRAPFARPAAALYERLLYRLSAGVIGWTPYLVGRALTFGARRAMTAPGWAPYPAAPDARSTVRRRLGIPEETLVFGLAGSLHWHRRRRYCYGLELVRAVLRTERPDVRALIIGDGSGRERLAALAGDRLGSSVILPGHVPRPELPSYLAAIDVASLPQSVDGVGAFRYTTKISEYLEARLPIVTGQIPLAYDLDDGWLWRLPGDAPWDDGYVAALSRLMGTLSHEGLAERRERLPRRVALFDRERQQRQVSEFVRELVSSGELMSSGI